MISQGNHGCSIHVYNLSLLTMRGLTKNIKIQSTHEVSIPWDAWDLLQWCLHYKILWIVKTSLADLTINMLSQRTLSWNGHRHSYFLWFVNDKFSMCKSRGTTDPYTVAEWCFCLWMYHEVQYLQASDLYPCHVDVHEAMCLQFLLEPIACAYWSITKNWMVMMCKKIGKTGLGSFNTNMLWHLVSHMLHVWNIYECLPTFTP